MALSVNDWLTAPLRCADAVFADAMANGVAYDPEAALRAALATPEAVRRAPVALSLAVGAR